MNAPVREHRALVPNADRSALLLVGGRCSWSESRRAGSLLRSAGQQASQGTCGSLVAPSRRCLAPGPDDADRPARSGATSEVGEPITLGLFA
jgi:hypothetical protein